MTIHLARHGQTAYNHEGRFQGHLPVPLDATGREQAAELAEVAAGVEIVTLVCSPLHRARETADIVAARIGLEPVEDARFAETDTGDWTGRSFAEIRAEDPEGFARFERSDPGFRYPGGESFAEQSDRVQAGLADLRARPAALPALVVCHRGVIRLALAVATFGAFFAAQRLKATPSVVGEFRRTPFFSPNHDGRFDRATVRFEIRKRGRVSLAVVDADGDEVKTLIDDDTFLPYREIRARWDGTNDDGARVRDGNYRYRITLADQGRNVVIPESVRLDTTPPRPRVTSIGPAKDTVPRPELLPIPGGGEAIVHLFAPGQKKKILLFKTGPGPVRAVGPPVPLDDSATEWRWSGQTETGRPVSPGTYLVAIQVRDQAGNIGTSPPLDRRGLPAITYGAPLPGRGGITVRYLGVQPPAAPVPVGKPVAFGVDPRGERWAYTVRRVGSNEIVARGAHTRGGVF